MAEISEVSLYNGASAENLAAFNPQKIASTGDIITVDAGDSVVAKIDAASGLLSGIQTEDFSGESKGWFLRSRLCSYFYFNFCPYET